MCFRDRWITYLRGVPYPVTVCYLVFVLHLIAVARRSSEVHQQL
jgi:hypothetical protein